MLTRRQAIGASLLGTLVIMSLGGCGGDTSTSRFLEDLFQGGEDPPPVSAPSCQWLEPGPSDTSAGLVDVMFWASSSIAGTVECTVWYELPGDPTLRQPTLTATSVGTLGDITSCDAANPGGAGVREIAVAAEHTPTEVTITHDTAADEIGVMAPEDITYSVFTQYEECTVGDPFQPPCEGTTRISNPPPPTSELGCQVRAPGPSDTSMGSVDVTLWASWSIAGTVECTVFYKLSGDPTLRQPTLTATTVGMLGDITSCDAANPGGAGVAEIAVAPGHVPTEFIITHDTAADGIGVTAPEDITYCVFTQPQGCTGGGPFQPPCEGTTRISNP